MEGKEKTMLSGLAKEQFEKWYISKSYQIHLVNFYGLEDSMQWGVYQDWADSLGYCVYAIQTHGKEYVWAITHNGKTWSNSFRETRQEARNAAIEKLNELINEL